MNCPRCQAKIAEGAQYCGSCGLPLQAQAQSSAVAEGNPEIPAAPAGGSQPLPYIVYPPPISYTSPASAPTPSVPSMVYQPASQAPGAYGIPAPALPGAYVTGPRPAGLLSTPIAPVQPGGHPYAGGVFGPDASPATARPATRFQAFLLRNLSARVAVNRWVMAAIGGVLAAAIASFLTALLQAVWNTGLNTALEVAGDGANIGATFSGFAQPLAQTNLPLLLALEHRVPLTAHLAGSGAVTLTPPLTGLVFVPLIGLLLGGYLAAASDFARDARYSVARGALIGPFYAIILTALTFFGSASHSLPINGTNVLVTISATPWQAFLYGLLWGCAFGALGGWIQLAGRGALSSAVPRLRASSIYSAWAARFGGAITGALAALVMGVLLFAALGLAGALYAWITAQARVTTAGQIIPGYAHTQVSPGAIGLLLLWIVVVAPAFGITAFAYATGTPVAVTISGVSPSTATSYGLTGFFGAQQLPPNHSWYLLALVPAWCYLTGGRIAARASGARNPGEGFLVGMLIAAPLSLFATLAVFLAGWGLDVTTQGQATSVSVGPDFATTFIVVLLSAAVLGGLGGSTLEVPWLGDIPRAIMLPLYPLTWVLGLAFDRVTGRRKGEPRTASRQWLYEAVLAAVILCGLVVALEYVDRTQASTQPFFALVALNALLGAAVVAIPAIYLIGALVTSLSASPAALAWPAAGAPSPAYVGVPVLPTPYAPVSPGAAAPIGTWFSPYNPLPSAPLPSVPGISAYPPTPSVPVTPASADAWAGVFATPSDASVVAPDTPAGAGATATPPDSPPDQPPPA